MAEKQKFTAIGRRKRSVAKVTLVAGKGNITVNGKDVTRFPRALNYIRIRLRPVNRFPNGRTRDAYRRENR